MFARSQDKPARSLIVESLTDNLPALCRKTVFLFSRGLTWPSHLSVGVDENNLPAFCACRSPVDWKTLLAVADCIIHHCRLQRLLIPGSFPQEIICLLLLCLIFTDASYRMDLIYRVFGVQHV